MEETIGLQSVVKRNGDTRTIGGLSALAAIFMLLLGGCQKGNDVTVTPDPKSDEAAIRAVLDAIAHDFNAGKMEQMVSHYQDDVVVSAPGAPDIAGKQAWLASIAATLPPGVSLTLRFDTSELQVAGDLAYERGTYAVGMADQPDPAQAMLKGRHIHIFKRQADGTWKGWRLMENSEDPATSPLPPQAGEQ